MINQTELYQRWKKEEEIAHIHGWDFSHLRGRYKVENDLPWDYRAIVKKNLTDEKKLLDYDTGGAEFLLSLGHPYSMTAATEGYPPNVKLCQERLLSLGVVFRVCDNPTAIPFADESFDVIINRHGGFAPREIFRLLKKGGVFITQQVGSENDRDLVEMVLPDAPKPFPQMKLSIQKAAFEQAGFQILQADEAFRPIRFYDIGAFVWFARVIEWEFPDFSVDTCFERLLRMQEILTQKGEITGTIHRYFIMAGK